MDKKTKLWFILIGFILFAGIVVVAGLTFVPSRITTHASKGNSSYSDLQPTRSSR